MTGEIPESLLEVREYLGEGYSPIVDYGEWRVAILNFDPKSVPDQMPYIERHNESDEVFVLLKGKCILYIGEGDTSITSLKACDMQPFKAYNVTKASWHCCTMSKDAMVLIVENRNTSEKNSSYIHFTPEQRQELVRLTKEVW